MTRLEELLRKWDKQDSHVPFWEFLGFSMEEYRVWLKQFSKGHEKGDRGNR